MNEQDYQGRYIVLEGPEGVGKTTQIEHLANTLQEKGYTVRLFREPDSQSDLTARTIRTITQDPRYPMNTKTEVLLYNAARSQSLDIIREARQNGIICLCDRNYLTTLAIQYYGKGDIKDYEMITKIISFAVGNMEPDLTIILDAPTDVLLDRIRNRNTGDRFDNLDKDFLDRVRAGYLWEANERGYPVISASQSSSQVKDDIWNLINGNRKKKITQDYKSNNLDKANRTSMEAVSVNKILAEKAQVLGAEKQSSIYIKKSKDGAKLITKGGYEYLKTAVTDTKGNVYAFTDELSQTTIAAAMARLSRRGDDMRVTILDEFAGKEGKDQGLLKRVITAYGDDSVQQLVGQHIVVENASNLLTKKLEWGRLAAYLEQSTRYIYYDAKDSNGQFKYYKPTNLPKKILKEYVKTMDDIFENYSNMVHLLTEYIRNKSTIPESERDIAFRSATKAQACDAVRGTLPVATKSTVGIFASGQALENLVMHLLSDELIEARVTGNDILKEARKIIPTFLERADKADRGGATVAYYANTKLDVGTSAKSLLSKTIGNSSEDVALVDYWPKNELDILPHMLYQHTDKSLDELKSEIAKWTYNDKVTTFNIYMGDRLNRRHRPGRALEIPHYSWDIVCDYGAFRDLQRHRMVDSLEWQQLTPRHGYDTPDIIEEAGIEDMFDACFSKSMKLYDLLISHGYQNEAQYVTLLGHRVRWKLTYNAREAFHLHELRTSPQGHPSYRKLVKQMHDTLAEVHPLIAEAMIFVNKDEDPELTRLAAEKATKYKLEVLDKQNKK